MANSKIPSTSLSDTINTQRLRFNQLIDSVGDISRLDSVQATGGRTAFSGYPDVASALLEHDLRLDSAVNTEVLTTRIRTTDSSSVNIFEGGIQAQSGITTVAATFNLVNTVATTVNIGGAGTTNFNNIDVGGVTSLDSVNIDQRLTVNDSAYITGNLIVGGNTDLKGTLTVDGEVNFKAGSSSAISFGDGADDRVVFNADVRSNLIPDSDSVYNIGSPSQEWNHGYFDGTLNADNISADSATISGNLAVTTNLDVGGITTLDSTNIVGPLTVDGVITSTGTAFSIAAETGTTDAVTLGDTITFSAGEGINTTVSDNQIEIAGEEATKTNKGVLSLDSADFTLASGHATIKTGGVTNAQLANDGITFGDGSTTSDRNLGESVTVQGTANEVEVSYTGGTFTVGLPNDVTIGNDLTVTNDFNVQGNFSVAGTVQNTGAWTENFSGLDSAPSGFPGGLAIDRGNSLDSAVLYWDETLDCWKAGTASTTGGSSTFTAKKIALQSDSAVFSNIYQGGTGATRIPAGTTAQRPTAVQGQIRYNTDNAGFEGYTGGVWSGLGGVKDVDGDTFIRSEATASADSDILEFIVADSSLAIMSADSGLAIDNITSRTANGDLTLSGHGSGAIRILNDLTVEDSAYITGNLTLGSNISLVNQITLKDKIIHDGDTNTHIAFDTDTIQLQTGGTDRVAVTDGTTRITNGLAIEDSAYVTGDLVIGGNLTVSGTTTTVNSTTVTLADNIIELNSNLADNLAPSANAGIEIERGNQNNAQLVWNETNNYFVAHNDSAATKSGTLSRIATADFINVTNALTYNSSTGLIGHADTSSQASVDNSGTTFIQDVTVDSYGHITALASAAVAENVGWVLLVDSANRGPIGSTETVNFAGGAGVDIAVDSYAGNTLTFSVDLSELSIGTGLDASTTSLSLDLSEFTDMTSDNDSSDEIILLDGGSTESRKAIGEIKTSKFKGDGLKNYGGQINLEADSVVIRSNKIDLNGNYPFGVVSVKTDSAQIPALRLERDYNRTQNTAGYLSSGFNGLISGFGQDSSGNQKEFSRITFREYGNYGYITAEARHHNGNLTSVFQASNRSYSSLTGGTNLLLTAGEHDATGEVQIKHGNSGKIRFDDYSSNGQLDLTIDASNKILAAQQGTFQVQGPAMNVLSSVGDVTVSANDELFLYGPNRVALRDSASGGGLNLSSVKTDVGGVDFTYFQFQTSQSVGSTGNSSRAILDLPANNGSEIRVYHHLYFSNQTGSEGSCQRGYLDLETTDELRWNVGVSGAGTEEVRFTKSGVNIANGLYVGNISTTPTDTEIRATGDITAFHSSDQSLKENVKTIEDASDIIRNIRGVRFEWTDEHIKKRGGEDGYFVQKNDIGVIAQEIEDHIPEVVREREDGTKAVDYQKMVAVLIEGVKQQQHQIDLLEKRVSILTSLVSTNKS